MHCMHMHVCTTYTTDRPSKQQLTQPGRTPPEELERARTTKPPAIHERFFPCGWNRFSCAELPPVWNVNPNLAVVNTTAAAAAAVAAATTAVVAATIVIVAALPDVHRRHPDARGGSASRGGEPRIRPPAARDGSGLQRWQPQSASPLAARIRPPRRR